MSSGRPRDTRIDAAVLGATIELLERDGYLRTTIANIAKRARTTTPAIYRRWPSKAHLVHEAVFPAQDFSDLDAGRDLYSDVRTLVRVGLDLLGRPAARAALPGLLADTTADGLLAADVLGRAAGSAWEWLHTRIEERKATGEVRPDVTTSTVFELIAGAAFVATATRPTEPVDAAWVDEIVELIVRGITP
jgi:AcrR family transcriptional regulator